MSVFPGIGKEIVDEVGDVMEAIVTGLSQHTPIEHEKSVTRTTKAGKKVTTTQKISITGLELLLMWAIYRRLGSLFPNLDALHNRYGEQFITWAQGKYAEGWTNANILAYVIRNPAQFDRQMGYTGRGHVATTTTYEGAGVKDITTSGDTVTVTLWKNIGLPE